jgi:hypothetical protein
VQRAGHGPMVRATAPNRSQDQPSTKPVTQARLRKGRYQPARPESYARMQPFHAVQQFLDETVRTGQ